MSSEGDVAFTALAISLVALVIAAGQLLQQIFGTADGFRKCQSSVIGSWSKKTRLVWRWKEFRFETKFTTPEIILYENFMPTKVESHDHSFTSIHRRSTVSNIYDLGNGDHPRELKETLHPPNGSIEESPDVVTWTSLLRQLYLLELERQESAHNREYNADSKLGVIYRERTWDLMPADVTLPVASSRLGVLVALGLRLGMTWENLDLGHGVLLATGNGHTLVSTMIRGLGITFQYNFNPDAKMPQLSRTDDRSSGVQKSLFIPRRASDLLSCGFIPGLADFAIPPIPLLGQNTTETARLLSEALTYLGVPGETIHVLTNVRELNSIVHDGGGTKNSFAINEMIALLSDFQPVPSSTANHIAWPMATNTPLSNFLFFECRTKLLQLLRTHRKVHDGTPGQNHMKDIETRVSLMEREYSNDFYCRWDRAIGNSPFAPPELRAKFLDDLRKIHDWTTIYFKKVSNHLSYKDLVAAHIVHATGCSTAAWPETNNVFAVWPLTSEKYVYDLHKLIDRVEPALMNIQELQGDPREMIHEAWWTLMLRGLAWVMSIHIPGKRCVPSKFYYDQTPVYIM